MEWENELLSKKVDNLLDAVIDLEDKLREIYRIHGEDADISRICNEGFEIVRMI